MYKSLSAEQAAKLAQALGPEFTAAAKNDLLNFADAVVGLSRFDYSAKVSPQAVLDRPKNQQSDYIKTEEKATKAEISKVKSK